MKDGIYEEGYEYKFATKTWFDEKPFSVGAINTLKYLFGDSLNTC